SAARSSMQNGSKPTQVDQQERLLLRKEGELEALGSTSATAQNRKTTAALESEIADLKPRVASLVERWQQHKSLSDNLQKTKQAIEEQNAALQAAESGGNVTRGAGIRIGRIKLLVE